MRARSIKGDETSRLSKIVLLSAVAAFALSSVIGVRPVHAQDATSPSGDQDADAQAAKAKKKANSDDTTTVVVTGTHISGVKPVGSETTSLSHDQIVATGMSNITDVVESLPEVQNVGTLREGSTSGYGGNPTQGTTINLRGLGPEATLTLVDGHRLAPSGAASAFTEATQLPIAAIERVEIVSDGASAIYGSDAVSGVVNYVVRKHFDGTEVSTRYKSTYGNYEIGGSITTGKSWENLGSLGEGNVILSYDDDYRSRFEETKSPYLSRNLTPFGGLNNSISGNTAVEPGIPGNIVVQNTNGTFTTYGLPNGANVGLTASGLSSTPNTSDPANYDDYVGAMHREQAVLFLNQDLTHWLSVSYEGFYTQRRTITRTYPNEASNFTLSPTLTNGQPNPYYVTGIPGVNGGSETVQYNLAKDSGPQHNINPDLTWTQTGSFHASMPYDWKMDGFATFGHDQTCGICNIGDNINTTAFQNEINIGAINPLSSTPLSQAQKSTFLGTNIQLALSELQDYGLKVAGPLFSLPAGKLRAAVGVEYQRNSISLENGANRNDDNAFGWDNTPSSHRTVGAAYVELYVPVISSDMNIPLVKDVNVDAAARTDHYSDFGSTTNPKIGFTWDINNDLAVLGSWGTSFRAPTLQDTNPDVYSVAYVNPFTQNNSGDPAIKNTFPGYTSALFLLGANPNLKPEKAKTYSLGFEYKPSQIRGLDVGATYYDIDYTNQIVFSPPTGLFLANAQYRQLYSKYMTPINNTGCVEGNSATYDPKLLPWLAQPFLYGGYTGSICSIDLVIDGREANLASTHQTGADVHWNYIHSTPFGFFSTGGAITKIIDATQTPVPGASPVKAYNRIYYPVGLRERLTFGLVHGPWNTNLFVNNTGSYLNNVTITDPATGLQRPYQRVGSYMTFDLGEAYIVPKDSGAKWMRGIRASVNVQNLFDRKPPIVLSGTSAYDASNADIYGRTTMMQLTKDF